MFFPKHSAQFKEALNALQGKKVAVLGHLRPDGDCIGSQVGLVDCLRALKIQAVAVNQDKTPHILEPFTKSVRLESALAFNPEGYTAVAVDCADRKLFGKILEEKCPKIALNVDHHLSNTEYADVNIIEKASAATAELLAGMLLDIGYAISQEAAQAFYMGIVTDTGQFKYPSTSLRTFKICTRLIEHGAHPANAALQLYENNRIESLHLLQRFLATLKLECDGKVCFGFLNEDLYRETNTSREDAESFVDYARSIEGVEIAILLEDTRGIIKGSLRAKNPKYRLDRIASQFQGGGHACAAGLRLPTTMEIFYPQFMKALREHLDWVNTNTTE